MDIRTSSFNLHPSSLRRGFTLVELLVVISIIAVLIGILIPVVGKIRRSSQEAATRSLIGQIDAACQAYFGDFNSYPGPMSHIFMTMSTQADINSSEPLYEANYSTPLTDGSDSSGSTGIANGSKRLTGTENLVLGLMGGLTFNNNVSTPKYGFNKDQLGLGAARFNPKRPGRANSYMQPTNLSAGKFTDEAGALNPSKDTDVPEFVDSFTNEMPILYMRARKGGAYNTADPVGVTNNNVVVDEMGGAGLVGQYNILEIAAYTQSSIGVGRTVKQSDYKRVPANTPNTLTYPHGLVNIATGATLGSKTSASEYPYNAYAYLKEPSSGAAPASHRARKQDQFVLISAGVDRVYGTEDDITNFGEVLP